jgi:hypothetical protein
VNLWEREIPPLADRLGRLDRPERLRLIVEAVDWTLSTMPGQIDDAEAADCIGEAMLRARAAVAQHAGDVELPQDLLDRLEEAQESAYEAGLPQLLLGLFKFFDDRVLSPMAIEDILFDCFEFSAQREEGRRDTLEEQEASPRLREIIAFQKELIIQAAG